MLYNKEATIEEIIEGRISKEETEEKLDLEEKN